MQSKIKSIIHRLNRRDIPLLPKFRINKYFKIILILFVVLSAVFVTKTILAQSDTSTTTETSSAISTEAVQEFEAKQSAMEEGNNQESWMKESLGSNAMVGVNILAGTIPNDVLEGKKNTTWVPGGLIGITNTSLAYLYNIPISGTEYIAYMKDNLLGKPAYAATGYDGFKQFIEIWKGFRNMTYVLFSVVFVVIGIMIMLRVKISPQAVITIQSAIPKLITSLILVTFSYAIVGLLIDFTYIITGLGLSIILKATASIPDFYTKATNNVSVMELLENPHLWKRMMEIVNIGGSPWILVQGMVNDIVLGVSGVGEIAGYLIGGITYILVFLILFIFVLVNLVKFTFGVAKCYITIILKTITAPLEIALGAIPNMKMGFGTWFTNIFANFMVFPISLIVLVFIKKIMDSVWYSTYIWTPSILSTMSNDGKFIATLFGLGGLLLLAKLPKLIPEFIFSIKPSPFGTAIGEGFKPIGDVGKFAGRGALQGGADLVEKKYSASNNPGAGISFLNTLRKTAATTGIVKDH